MKDKALWLFLILGLVFRLVNFERSFYFAHDQDLYSWIAKDIVVNHHQRLVGQVTSVDGVFIGSFYYYLMAVFYAFSGMNPLSAVIPLTILGLFSILSIYWVVNNNFGRRAGLIAGFIYAVSFGIASFDRWSVPTQPTLLWSIWFLAVILGLFKGNLKYLPLYGFLCGFVWQLHIALLPILPIPVIAFLIGNNKINLLWKARNIKFVLLAVCIFLVTLSPFLLFEFKHNFSQIKAMTVGINVNTGAVTGMPKLIKVIETSGRELLGRLWIMDFTKFSGFSWILLILAVGYILFKNIISKKILFLFFVWYFMILLAQFVSKRVVSEYYFTNLLPIYIVVLAVSFDKIFNIFFIFGLAIVYLYFNAGWLHKSDYDQSYFYHRQVVEYIKNESIKNNYNCVAINFIADPGVGVGFRYLFWYYGVKLVKPGTPGVPVYNIPIPWQLSAKENPKVFGRFGVLKPVRTNTLINSQECKKPEYQLDPLLGYTE